jgi:ribonuclease HI
VPSARRAATSARCNPNGGGTASDRERRGGGSIGRTLPLAILSGTRDGKLPHLPLQVMHALQIVVFTDGASKRNPGPGGWGVIIVTPDGHVTELGGGAALTTNNKMELTGAIEALTRLQGTSGPIAVYTDSAYVIQGIGQWVHNWRRRGWKTSTGSEVLNRELWERLFSLTAARVAGTISWHYVRGHVGIPGNERVDEIADAFAVRKRVALYEGPLAGYRIPILDLPDDTSLPKRSSSTASSATSRTAAFSYLSVVDGKLMRHATWAECEQRVKGRSGARFKKAASPADEAAILRAWQFDPGDV